MLREACFVWNHALALQKRYYRLYGKYINTNRIQKHFAKRISRNLLHSQTVQEILQRLDTAYQRFFNHIAKRPPKFRKAKDFSSILFKQGGYSLNDNVLTINSIKKRFKFSLSRPYAGKVKALTVKRNHIGEFFIVMVLEQSNESIGKSHNGASVGIDFGLKTYMTLSDGTEIKNPQFMKENLTELRRRSRNLSKCKKGSNNRERKRKELDRLWNDICNKRDDFQWKLAHDLCRKYDNIFIENLNLADMSLGRKANRKLKDQAHAEFITKLLYVATKYDVVVHKIYRYYPSSKTCTCGYVNNDLKLTDRQWTCPHCGTTHDRDLLAANNILCRGIYELESGSKSKNADGVASRSRLHRRISFLQG
jgi:putative transposase